VTHGSRQPWTSIWSVGRRPPSSTERWARYGRCIGHPGPVSDLSRCSLVCRHWSASLKSQSNFALWVEKINESMALHTWHLRHLRHFRHFRQFRHFRHFRHLRRLPCHLAKPGILRHFFRVQIIPSQPCRISLWAVIKATAQAALEVKSWCRCMTPTVCTLYTTLYHIYWICDWCDVLNYHTNNIWIIISIISGFFE